MTDFGVETIDVDLPPLVGALSRRLRDAGLPTTPARAADFARALGLVQPIARRRLYWTARAVFVSDPTQVKVFDAVFFSVFGGRAEGEELVLEDPQTVASPLDSLSSSSPSERDEDEEPAEVEVPLALASDEELLRRKSFDALEPHELAQLYRLMSRLELATPLRRTRRYEKGRRGERIDMRRTLRASLRTGGHAIRLTRRHRRIARRRLVLLCDISGSMEPYARAYLQFLACAAGSGPNAEAFVFATRLTRVTRALASRNPELAIQRAAAAAPDWSSGTRIGDALREFNDRHGRRGMARGAVIVILSDGWERGDPMLVGREMERLATPGAPDRVGQSAGRGRCLLRPGRRHDGRSAALRRARERTQLRCTRRGRRGDRSRVVGPGLAGSRGRGGRAVGKRHAGTRQLRRDAQRARPEQGKDHAGLGDR